jgi:adenylate cyclase
MLGEMIPFGGGDPIPLLRPQLLLGRRESCDVVLRFPNVSAHHCELTLEQGYWFVRDLNSRNGTKVNGLHVTVKKRIDPGDRLSLGRHHFEVNYSPAELGAQGPPPDDMVLGEVLGQSLMKGAGLERRDRQAKDGRIGIRRPAPAASQEVPDLPLDVAGDEQSAPDAGTE